MQANICIAVLYIFYLKKDLSPIGKLCFAAVFGGTALIGLASGNLIRLFYPILVKAVIYWKIRQRIPWLLLIACLLIFVTLQPLKSRWRQDVWIDGNGENSITHRVGFWGELLADEWGGALADSNTQNWERNTRSSIMRTDYIHTFAHVLSLTPSEVPYQYGRTYSYFVVSLIPRALWANKPSAQGGDYFFAAAYGFLSTDDAGVKTFVAMPQIAETFINFGTPGIIIIMMLIGLFYGSLDHMLGHSKAGEGGSAIYVALMIGLLSIDSGAAGVFCGAAQNFLLYYVILRAVRGKSTLSTELSALELSPSPVLK